jgi:FemAB-related protein (PEP-CTERM system-associated)
VNVAADGAARSETLPVVRALLGDASTRAWNEYVERHPDGTFFHLSQWRDVIRRAFGHSVHYLFAERNGEIRGVLPLVHVRSLLFGNALVSTPFCVYGGIVADDANAHAALTQHACELAHRLGVDYLEMRNRKQQHPEWQSKDLYVTFRRAILAEADENMLAIPRKQRAMVRKGIQKNLRSEVDADVDRNYDIYSESLRNLGTPAFSRKYLKILKEVFGDRCEVRTIVSGVEPIASVLSFYFRDEVLPYYGGGTAAARAVAANDFMYWEVMEAARRRGLRIFDFGRSKRGTGSFDFKEHWGFQPEPLCYEYYLVKARAVPNLSPTNPKYQRFIRLWRRLPLKVTWLVGPFFANYLG